MFRFMEREKAEHHVATMARTLGVSPSGFYAQRTRPRSLHAFADEIVVDLIRKIHAESRGTYGAPRVQAELRLASGIGISRKRIARLMRQEGLAGISRRRTQRTTVRDARATPAPDLVQRAFRAAAPNTLWVADITYVPTLQGFLYLACVSSTSAPAGWSAGRCARRSRPRSSPPPWTWPSPAPAPRRG